MTNEDFIEILDGNNYSYEMSGDNIVVTKGDEIRGLHLVTFNVDDGIYIIDSIPEGVIFKNEGLLNLSSLEEIPDGVEFRNIGDLWLYNISTSEIPKEYVFYNTGSIRFSNKNWDNNWSGNIEGINDKRLMNLMIRREIF